MLTDKSIIETEFQPLLGNEKVGSVKDRIADFSYEQFPVVDPTTQKYIGQVAREDLLEAEDEEEISNLELDEAVKIYLGQHIFEVARLMLQHELRLLPVIDKEWTFLGIINKEQVLVALSQMLNLSEKGSVITVELNPIDFSLSEIVQIIETEGAKILGITVESPSEENQNFEVSFKLNLKDVSRVTAALNRYEYAVITEPENTVFGEDLEHRADELLKYIDM